MLKEPLFYAKILLFGEYGIIQNSMGLSIPYADFRGSLKFEENLKENAKYSNTELQKFHSFLNNPDNNLDTSFNLSKLKVDIDKGLYFDSSIPQGFGIGSSGALCAAIYDNYAVKKLSNKIKSSEKLLELKSTLGAMESYFHGKSSGLDPLICYLNLPVLIKKGNQMGAVGLPMENMEGKGAIFLLNSGSPGKTSSMVNIFMEKLKNEGFRTVMKKQFVKYNDECINAFLKGEVKSLFKNVKELSSILLENFSQMIPTNFHGLWKEGIDSNSYYLKLCGSGGGGYILGFAPDIEIAKAKLKNYKLEIIHKF
jgi:mevalonate kinase